MHKEHEWIEYGGFWMGHLVQHATQLHNNRIISAVTRELMVSNTSPSCYQMVLWFTFTDSALYHASGVDAQISSISDRNGNTMMVFADSAYGLHPHLIAMFKNSNKTAAQIAFNTNMSSVWQCVEWGFGKLKKQFAFLQFDKNLKVLLQPVPEYFKAAVLLCNVHTCLYGS